jgi:hypothetical protein
MSRLIRIRLLTALCLVAFTTGASACLNDRESSKSEREFKSRYNDPPAAKPADPAPASSLTDRLFVYGGTGLGAALLVGGLTVTFLPRRRV